LSPLEQQIVIRELARADLQPLLALYRQLHPNDAAFPANGADVWAAIVQSSSLIYLGAFSGPDLVASCHAAVIPNLTRGARPYAVVENVITDAAFRGRGIGSALMRALLQRCWALGCYKVMLQSAMARQDVHGFYVALGFDKDAKQAFVIGAPPTVLPGG
jgi:GNAT superfamily N-acetyltransferase